MRFCKSFFEQEETIPYSLQRKAHAKTPQPLYTIVCFRTIILLKVTVLPRLTRQTKGKSFVFDKLGLLLSPFTYNLLY